MAGMTSRATRTAINAPGPVSRTSPFEASSTRSSRCGAMRPRAGRGPARSVWGADPGGPWGGEQGFAVWAVPAPLLLNRELIRAGSVLRFVGDDLVGGGTLDCEVGVLRAVERGDRLPGGVRERQVDGRRLRDGADRPDVAARAGDMDDIAQLSREHVDVVGGGVGDISRVGLPIAG